MGVDGGGVGGEEFLGEGEVEEFAALDDYYLGLVLVRTGEGTRKTGWQSEDEERTVSKALSISDEGTTPWLISLAKPF